MIGADPFMCSIAIRPAIAPRAVVAQRCVRCLDIEWDTYTDVPPV